VCVWDQCSRYANGSSSLCSSQGVDLLEGRGVRYPRSDAAGIVRQLRGWPRRVRRSKPRNQPGDKRNRQQHHQCYELSQNNNEKLRWFFFSFSFFKNVPNCTYRCAVCCAVTCRCGTVRSPAMFMAVYVANDQSKSSAWMNPFAFFTLCSNYLSTLLFSIHFRFVILPSCQHFCGRLAHHCDAASGLMQTLPCAVCRMVLPRTYASK
jgi:hypothetical protein